MNKVLLFIDMSYRSPIMTALGIIAGAVTTWTMMEASSWREEALRRRAEPVVHVTSTLIKASTDGVLLRVGPGEKLRECEYLGIQGFLRQEDGFLAEVSATRVDTPELKQTKPVGKFADFGIWKLYPSINGADRAYLFVNHDCNGYTKVSTIADVEIPSH